MKKYILIGFAFSLFSAAVVLAVKFSRSQQVPSIAMGVGAFSPETPKVDLPVSNKKHKIQVALLLDTSNSMDGLIEQAKSQLWKLINELAGKKKENDAPGVEIALYEYGNDHLSAIKGYVRQVAPLTTDLDYLSEKLFALRTNGGEEYCGWVMKDALSELAWSQNESDLKLMVIAGNESFNQGSVGFSDVCRDAAKKGIAVHSIFCGEYGAGWRLWWKESADLTQGTYSNINHNDLVEHIPTPYDDSVEVLNSKLNSTYMGFGSQGTVKLNLQMTQDDNAGFYSKANQRERSFAKSKEVYKNEDWDFVDAAAKDEKVLDLLSAPEEVKALNPQQRKDFVDKKRAERESIQLQLHQMEKKVNEYIAAQHKAGTKKQTLDNVMIESLRMQAKKKGFE